MSASQATSASLVNGGYGPTRRTARNAQPATSSGAAAGGAAAPAPTSTGADAPASKGGSGAAVNSTVSTARPANTDGAAANGSAGHHHLPPPSQRSSGAATAATSSHSVAKASTESVIEELKALAKSMLEATNAARRRTSSIEQRNSYEALMHAIENRVNGDTCAEAKENGAAVAKHVDPASPNDLARPEPPSAHLIEQLTDIPAALSPASGSGSGSGGGSGSGAVAKQPQPQSQLHLPSRQTAVPASTAKVNPPARAALQQPPQTQPSRPRTEDPALSGDVEEVESGSQSEHDEVVVGKGEKERGGAAGEGRPSTAFKSQAPLSRRGGAPAVTLEADEDDGDAEDEEDDDGTAYDGVRTQVLFKPVNRAAYREVVASTWKPEGLTRRVSTAGSSGGSSSEQPKQTSSGSGSSGSGSKDSPHHLDSAAAAAAGDDMEDGDSSDEAPMATVSTRNKAGRAAARAAPSMKVYRVPSFPYGGGVTERQARLLQRLFDTCIQNGAHLSSNAAGPALITKEAFDSDGYPEVAAATAQSDSTSFQPTSPYEFVVEVEHEVRFDAVKAREERRQRFRQLVRENRAPATMGTFNLRVIMDPFKTGFEEEKNFPIVAGTVIAGRYEIIQMLGKATFSRAVRCYDLQDPIYDDDDEDEVDDMDDADGDDADNSGDDNGGGGGGGAAALTSSPAEKSAGASLKKSTAANGSTRAGRAGSAARLRHRQRKVIGYGQVCLKIINNTKDFFDQSLDEIRLLTLLNRQRDPDEVHVVRLIDAFYYKEHVMLVTELLRDTLYDYGKYNREEEEEFYFTVPRLRRLTRQIVEALTYVHSLNLIHTDLKPENIMFVSYSRCIVKVIDFGSSCFLSDHLSSYIQSRSYRAPEVVLGCDYDGRIDVWSLGAILVEMVTGDVLFTSDTVPEMLARIVYVCGTPFPRRMLWEGRHTSDYINKFGCIYEHGDGAEGQRDRASPGDAADDGEETYCLYTPVPTMTPHTCASSRRSRAAAVAHPSPPQQQQQQRTSTTPYSVLREKLAAANMVDESFISFVEACLTLDHKRRPTTAELLGHPFIRDEVL